MICNCVCKMFLLVILLFCFKSNSVTYLFSHGFADRGKQVNKYVREYKSIRGKICRNNFYIIDGPVKIFNYPDASCKPLLPNFFKACFGQEADLNCLRVAHGQIKDDEIVLVGVSRGASAAATFVGESKPKKIKAVILISPYAHLSNVFKPGKFSKFLYRFLRKISSFKEGGKHPMDWIGKMDKSIPVMFVCSKVDKTVPCFSTFQLYRKLVQSGHKHVYILCLPSGKHAKLLKSKYASTFQNVIHAFYCKYGLPHDEEFANKGWDCLQSCKLSAKDTLFEHEYEEDKDEEDEFFDRLADSFITILTFINSNSGKFLTNKLQLTPQLQR